MQKNASHMCVGMDKYCEHMLLTLSKKAVKINNIANHN